MEKIWLVREDLKEFIRFLGEVASERDVNINYPASISWGCRESSNQLVISLRRSSSNPPIGSWYARCICCRASVVTCIYVLASQSSGSLVHAFSSPRGSFSNERPVSILVASQLAACSCSSAVLQRADASYTRRAYCNNAVLSFLFFFPVRADAYAGFIYGSAEE
jgi:hypothetical protein